MKLPPFDDVLERFESEAAFEREFPDRPISSLRDVQYLYGKLYTLATAGGGEYAPYRTPDQATDLLGEPESLVVVQVDLTDPDTPRLDPDTPVRVTQYSREQDHVSRVAHAYYDSARGVDHSITHRTGRDKNPEKIAEYALERFTRWPTRDPVEDVAERHDQGWVIDALQTLGADEDATETIEAAVESQLGGTATSLVTVAVKLDADGPYLLPGDDELEVFDAAMRARVLSKLVSKGPADESAGGATDLVTGEETRTVGTAEDPLNYYLGKQLEKFPGLDPEAAWRSHPISEEAAVTLMNAEPFVDACTYTTFGATVYYLPYFPDRPDTDQLRQLYFVLQELVNSGDEDMTPVEQVYRQIRSGKVSDEAMHRLRFYVTAVMKHQAKRFDVFGDTMNAKLLYPVEVAKAHADILDTWVFDDVEVADDRLRAAMPTHEEWGLLNDAGKLNPIASAWYFHSTFAPQDDDQDVAADDARVRALVDVLSGTPLSVEMLLGEYVERIADQHDEEFPDLVVSSQFAQLSALARAGLLTTDRPDAPEYRPLTDNPDYQTTQMHATDSRARADGGTVAAARADKLAQFIRETPALRDDESRSDAERELTTERRGAFLLGVLVGQVGGYQSGQGRSQTVVDQYPIKSITKHKLKRISQEVLDKDIVYSREENLRGTMYGEVVDRLVETLAARDPGEWGLGTDDLRFYYALGVSYGMNNWTDTDDTTEDDQ